MLRSTCSAVVLAALLTAPQLPVLEALSVQQQEKKLPEKSTTPVTGEIVAVDPNAKSITIKTGLTEQGEMKFSYSEATEIVGGEKGGPEALAGAGGTMAKVTYDVHGTANVAIRIEILPKQQ
jgi:hypothetical protein